MDEDALWLTDALGRAAPKLTFTLWRGLPPLTAWWLLACKQTGTHFMFSHSYVAERDERELTRALTKARLPP